MNNQGPTITQQFASDDSTAFMFIKKKENTYCIRGTGKYAGYYIIPQTNNVNNT